MRGIYTFYLSLSRRLAIQRIFWKFFASFWLANLCIMLATTYVLLHHSEAEHHRQEYQRGISLMVEHLLAADTSKEQTDRNTRRILRRMIRGPRDQPHAVRVYEQGQLILKFESRPNLPTPEYIFDLELADGRQLQVHSLGPRLPKMLLDIVQKVHKLHLFFMLLVSAVVSFLLSWSITRPLALLGKASRQFALEQQVTVDNKLLKRADEIGQLARDFDSMMATVTKTLVAQKQLLHDVSHELRAPLARLQVAAELIQQKDQHDNPHCQRIHQECQRVDQLIQRILQVARLQQTSQPCLFDLHPVLEKLLNDLRYENPERTVHTTLADTPLPVFGRRELLEHAIENVFRNACKYTPESTVIEVDLRRQDDMAVVIIRDHGPGVAEQELEKLQIPFYRGGQQMHGSGFGLGLSIAHRAIDAQGGQLQFSNHPNGGLQVRIHLPLHLD